MSSGEAPVHWLAFKVCWVHILWEFVLTLSACLTETTPFLVYSSVEQFILLFGAI